jgi:hypothetical protein
MTYEQIIIQMSEVIDDAEIAKILGVTTEEIQDDETLSKLTIKYAYDAGYKQGQVDLHNANAATSINYAARVASGF